MTPQQHERVTLYKTIPTTASDRREEQSIIDAENAGEISHDEATKQLNDLARDYQGAAEEAATRAYEDEMARW
jgi:polyhydroxyalkanoate synthesis regulator phasin